MNTELSERQLREREEFNRRAPSKRLTAVDLDHYNHPRFGPWSAYWTIWNFVLTNFSPDRHTILSFGCGRGREALRYASRGFQVAGFDISEELVKNAIELAEQYDLSNKSTFSVQAAEGLDYADESFDVIVGENILHHIDIERSVKEMYRVLRPGGVALFKDSLETPIRDRFRNLGIVKRFVPAGTKNLKTGQKYTPTEDERPLNQHDLSLLREGFGNLEVRQFRVLATLATIFGDRPRWERVDDRVFRVAPFLRRFGDNVVLILRKQVA